jgi:dTDP-glucose 4,6-dehydratase
MALVFVTGGAGFIGNNFVRRLIHDGHSMINLDILSYAGNRANLTDLKRITRHEFVHGSIGDSSLVERLLSEHRPNVIVNFAAETHVDRSIDSPSVFMHTNVVGTFVLLEAALVYWLALPAQERTQFRFVHISTDEVYGSIAVGRCTELSRYEPSSPYSASKAAADHLVRAYYKTYGLPVLITNCCNNYGPRQFPEKLIPKTILSALAGRAIHVYGDGLHRRDWLHVDDHCNALVKIIEGGRPGETYNVGGHGEQANLEVVHAICDRLDKIRPRPNPYRTLIEFVPDRPGHDRRYCVDATKLESELGWLPGVTFEAGLSHTVDWYLSNPEWCERIRGAIDPNNRIGFGSRNARASE